MGGSWSENDGSSPTSAALRGIERKTSPQTTTSTPRISNLRTAVVGYSWRFLTDPVWVQMRSNSRGVQPFNASGVSPLVGRHRGPDWEPGGVPVYTYEYLSLEDDSMQLWDYSLDEMQGATGRIPTVEPQGDVYLTKIDALNHEAFVFWYEEGNSESWEFLKKTLRLTILPQRQKSVTRTEKKFDYGDVSIIDVGSEECTHVDISKVPFVIVCIRCARMDAPYKYTSTKSVSTGVEKEARECAKQLDCPFIQVDISDRAKTLNTFKLLFKEAQRLGFTKSGKMADCNVSWELEHIIKD